jgi:hypothetical protein
MVEGNQLRNNTGSPTTRADGYWAAGGFGPDCEAFATVGVTASGPTDEIWLYVRATGSGASLNCYTLLWNGAASQDYSIGVISNGSATTIQPPVLPDTPAPAAGEKLGLIVRGEEDIRLTAYLYQGGTWNELGMRQSVIKHTGPGSVGVMIRNSVFRLDDFGGGTAEPSPSPPPPSPEPDNPADYVGSMS